MCELPLGLTALVTGAAGGGRLVGMQLPQILVRGLAPRLCEDRTPP
jgi:hypothetical protein